MNSGVHAGALRRVVLVVAAVVVLLGGITLALAQTRGAPTGHDKRAGWPADANDPTAPSAPTPSHATVTASTKRADPADPADPADYQLVRLRALKPPPAGANGAPITGEPTRQPDLYAAEFVRRLLTQDYRGDRATLLRWVHAESSTTPEPLVVGLIPPELRDRYALFSVTDTSAGELDATPIPSPAQWEALGLQHGYTSVTVDRVEEPLAWTNAVASRRITDPGITARDVSATVTLRTTVNGQPHATTFSVAMSVNLEGPPTTRSWRFVAAITYTSIQVS